MLSRYPITDISHISGLMEAVEDCPVSPVMLKEFSIGFVEEN